jgi:hypothetical protein
MQFLELFSLMIDAELSFVKTFLLYFYRKSIKKLLDSDTFFLSTVASLIYTCTVYVSIASHAKEKPYINT